MSYIQISKHYEACYKEHGDNYKGVDWPNQKDAEKRYEIMLEIIDFDTHHNVQDEASVLDFGCGLGHMYEYILKKNKKVRYLGLDLSKIFIEKCMEKYPNVPFYQLDFLKDTENNLPKVDYMIMNGVFTEKLNLTFNEMFSYFKDLVKKAYEYCNCGLALNVMSKDVDWEREDLFHLSLSDLSAFLVKEVTRDFIVRYDYGLYEYTVYIYKAH